MEKATNKNKRRDVQTKIECMECGHTFKKKIGQGTFEVKCPKCGSYDTDLA